MLLGVLSKGRVGDGCCTLVPIGRLIAACVRGNALFLKLLFMANALLCFDACAEGVRGDGTAI
jgi:hypothetical protein